MGFTITMIVLAVLVLVTLAKGIRIVPQKQAWIVERLGKYHETLNAGLHILIPYMDRVAYKIGLKEVALDVPPQQCVTRDNITVEIDGLLYLQVIDPVRASYGITNYVFACSQLAQTTLAARSASWSWTARSRSAARSTRRSAPRWTRHRIRGA